MVAIVTRALKCKPSVEKQCTPCTADKDVDLCMRLRLKSIINYIMYVTNYIVFIVSNDSCAGLRQ